MVSCGAGARARLMRNQASRYHDKFNSGHSLPRVSIDHRHIPRSQCLQLPLPSRIRNLDAQDSRCKRNRPCALCHSRTTY
jgi:hypothetical protein